MRNLLQQRWFVRLRSRVEQEMRKILRDHYRVEVDSSTPIKYYLDFKSDERLLQLRDTLNRMETGTFGTCLLCGESIDIHLLNSAPASQFCRTCTGGLQTSPHKDFRRVNTNVQPTL